MAKRTDHVLFGKTNERKKPRDAEHDPVELCIICGAKTPYRFSTPIDERKYYVPGLGQICERCHYQLLAQESSWQV